MNSCDVCMNIVTYVNFPKPPVSWFCLATIRAYQTFIEGNFHFLWSTFNLLKNLSLWLLILGGSYNY